MTDYLQLTSKSAESASPSDLAGKKSASAPGRNGLYINFCELAGIEDSSHLSTEEKLKREVGFQKEHDQHQSLLGKGLCSIFGTQTGGASGLLERTKSSNADQLLNQIVQNRDNRVWNQDVEEIGGALLKTACLFARANKWTMLATAAVYALDEMKPGTAGTAMALDGALGAAKGLSMKAVLSLGHNTSLSAGETGVALGLFGRFSDTALSRTTYLTKDGQLASGGDIADRIGSRTFDPMSIAGDYVLFSAANGMFKGISALSRGAVESNPFWKTVVTGQSLGMASGFSTELSRQRHEGEFDPTRLLTKTVVRGTVEGIAAMGGGWQALKFSGPGGDGTANPTGASRDLLRFERLMNKTASPTETETAGLGELTGWNANGEPLGLRTLRAATMRQELAHGEAGGTASRQVDPAQIRRLRAELGPPEVSVENHKVLKSGELTRSDNLDTWAAANLVEATRDVHVYRVGQVDVVVPAKYDAELNVLREAIERTGGKLDTLPESDPAYKLRDRLLPEELIPHIRSTPNPAFIRRVSLLSEQSPYDHFFRQESDGHTSQAISTPDGELNLHQVRRTGLFAEDFLHEWAHIFRWQSPDVSNLFDQAAAVEAGGAYARDYAKISVDENWAVHFAEELASPNAQRAALFAHRAPVRSAVILQSLKDQLQTLPAEQRTSRHDQLQPTVDSLFEPTMLAARKTLVETINNSGNEPSATEAATKLLLRFGTDESLASVKAPVAILDYRLQTVRDTEFANMARLPGVDTVDLSAANFSESDLTALARVPGLHRLSLRRTNLSNFGLRELTTASPQLQVLDVSANKAIDGASIPSLRGLIGLKELDLRGTSMTAAEVAGLRRSLTGCNIVH